MNRVRPIHGAAAPVGFTLLELMLALSISTLILGATGGILFTMLGSWEQGSRVQQSMRTAQSVLDLMERHVRSAVPPGVSPDVIFWGEDLSDEETTGHRLTLLSTAESRLPRSLPPTHMSEIEFELDPEEEDGLTMRVDSVPDEFAASGGYRLSLSDRVVSFQVLYFDGEEWEDEWFTNQLPQAIEVQLVFETPREEDALEENDRAADEWGPRETYQFTRLISIPRARVNKGRRLMGEDEDENQNEARGEMR